MVWLDPRSRRAAARCVRRATGSAPRLTPHTPPPPPRARAGLHLTVRPRDAANCADWVSTEAWAVNPLGYASYAFVVSGAWLDLDPQVTFGAFLWDDDAGVPPACGPPRADCWHREVDFEISKWGVASNPPLSFTVQPWSTDGSTRDPLQSHLAHLIGATSYGGQGGSYGCDEWGPDGFGGQPWQTITLVLDWRADKLNYYVFNGAQSLASASTATPLTSWSFRGERPTPGGARVHFNLWQVRTGTTTQRTAALPGRARPRPLTRAQPTP